MSKKHQVSDRRIGGIITALREDISPTGSALLDTLVEILSGQEADEFVKCCEKLDEAFQEPPKSE